MGKLIFRSNFQQSGNAQVEHNRELHCNVDLPRYFKLEGFFYTTTTTADLPDGTIAHKMRININSTNRQVS